MTNGEPAIVVEQLGKTFQSPAGLRDLLRGRLFGRGVTALADVSFTVAPGEIACVMGPNGAGKSTLVRILGGLLLPSAGRASVAGIDAQAGTSAFRSKVAFVVGDERSFHYRVTGRSNLLYFAALQGRPPEDRRAARARRAGRGGRPPLPRVLARHAPAAGDRARAAGRSPGVAAG
jgi:ABC-type multidrug transport system ATPase subunit